MVYVMNQQEIWDKISKKWYEYRKVKDREVTEFLKNKKGKLLDVGCGSGRNFVKKASLQIYGVDFSGKMLEFAKGEAKKRGIKVILEKSRTEKLPFEDKFFDYVICVAVLHCVDTDKKRKDSLKEIYRVLKVGGEALISVWGPNSPRINKIKLVKTGKKKEFFVPWTLDGEKYGRYTYLFDKMELNKILKDVGFKILSFEEDRNLSFVVKKS